MRRLVRDRRIRSYGALALAAAAVLWAPEVRADFASSCPVDWSFFGAPSSYTFLGQPIADYETSADPSTGGAAATPTDVDLASGSPGSLPGTEDTPAYSYFDGGTAYDPASPATLEDDFVLFRLRIAGDNAFKDGFQSRHWNVLVDVDDDGYKEYWVDINGPYVNGNGYDQLQVLYDNDSRQDIPDPAVSRVEEFRAYYLGDGSYYAAACDTGAGAPSAPANLNPTGSASFSRRRPVGDGTGDYWLEVQVPLTAFNDLLGNQVVYPNSPVAFVFSTSASNTDPLQKDWMMDLNFLSLSDPITFGDVVKLNGEPDLHFADAALGQQYYYEVAPPPPTCADPVYLYLKATQENTDPATIESVTVTVTNPVTGDDDQVTLVETGPGSGVFANIGGATTPVSSRPANAWVRYVTTSTQTVAETWTLTYVNASGTWTVVGSASGLQPVNATAATAYTSVTGGVSFTLFEDAPNALTDGDTITFTTVAADPLCTTWSDGTADNSDNDGTIEALSGDTLHFSYTDPATAATYTATAEILGACLPFIQFTRANGLPNSNFELNPDPDLSDLLYVTVHFAPANTSAASAQSLAIVLGGYDTQALTLVETGVDTGVFRNTTGLTTKVSDGTVGANDALWEDVDGGVVTATYDFSATACCGADPGCPGTATATSTLFYTDAAGRVNFTNAAGTQGVVSYAVTQPVFVRVDDENLAACVPAVPTNQVTVTVTSDVGDSETITLFATAAGSGVFMNKRTDLATAAGSNLVTSASSDFVAAGVLAGDPFVIATGADAGNYTVSSVVSATQALLDRNLTATATGVVFSAGGPVAATYDGSFVADDGLLEARNLDAIMVEYDDCNDGDLDAGNDIKTDTAVYRAPVIVIDEVYFQNDCSGSAEAEYVRILNAAADAGDPANTKDLSALGYALSDGASVDPVFFDFSGRQAESLGTSDCPGAALGAVRSVVLEPGDSAYVFLTNIAQLAAHQYYCDDGTRTTYYLYAYDAAYDGNWLDDGEDQLVLEDGGGLAEDYVAWNAGGAPAADFLSDDAAAVTAGIWQDNAFRDVSGIADCSAIARIAEGYDTNVPADWGYVTALGNGRPVVTQAVVSSLKASVEAGEVVVSWETASESGTLGFFLSRRAPGATTYEPVTTTMLPALFGSPQGGSYRVKDPGAVPGKTFEYLLEEIEVGGGTLAHGPYTVRAAGSDGSGSPTLGFERAPRRPSTAAAARRAGWGGKAATKSSRRGGSAAAMAAKITVAAEGLHRVPATEIATALGLGVREVKSLVRRRRLALASRGSAVAWAPAPDDAGIIFHGRVVDDLFSQKNVYWLTFGEGRVMRSLEGVAPEPAPEGQSFTATMHVERDLYANPLLFSDPESDYWQWDFFVSGFPGYDARSFGFEIVDLAPDAAPALLSVSLVGGMGDTPGQRYRAALELNGVGLGDCAWEGTTGSCAVEVPADVLRAGENALAITAVADAGAAFAIFHLDSFDVAYARRYAAADGSLVCTGGGNAVVTIGGFADPAIAVLDLSDPDAPAMVAARSVAPESDGSWSVSFVPASPSARYLAVVGDATRAPESVAAAFPTDLRDAANAAEYLIVAPELLVDAAASIAEYRAGQGYRVRTVSFESIVDEFGHGIPSPDAVRAFLRLAADRWLTPPRHVLLVGEGTYDYRNLTGAGDNLLPALLVPTEDGLAPSDTALADTNGDGVPEMAIGRLPVLTDAEVGDVLDKIRAFESATGTWRTRALWLADRTVAGGDFGDDADAVARLLPAGVTAERIYLSPTLGLAAARARVQAGLRAGAGFLNFFGHAGLDRLTADGLLTADDVARQSASGGAPVVTAMTCVAGQFAIGGYDSLAEALVLKRGGGATAVWSSSGLSVNEGARMLDEEFYRALSSDGVSTLGEAARIAALRYRQRGGGPDLPRLYNLLGDPALSLR